MMVRDRKVGKQVDVADRDCPKRNCYWPRPDPGHFVQGRGYSQRPGCNRGWLCGTREVRGCPSVGACEAEDPSDPGQKCRRAFYEGDVKCRHCGAEIPEDRRVPFGGKKVQGASA